MEAAKNFKETIEKLMAGSNKFIITLTKAVPRNFLRSEAQSSSPRREFEVYPTVDKINFSPIKGTTRVEYERVYSDMPSCMSQFLLNEIEKVEEILPT